MSEDMKRELNAVKSRLDAIDKRFKTVDVRFDRMDGFAGILEDSRYRWAIHADALAKHDKRLSRLEAKRA